ncbi:hypothetical protein BT63DRAFT_215671 [Microthyrium microscopicum]|uniref:RING-type domain-containing protein n=1 Tax=Microthyrium microscopicum TaxID=703497 RepID=A0A6A6UI64_9PEZI|nr:hypothetical protein BT63DRAFT_215671 [Microthyrium microscopicum]
MEVKGLINRSLRVPDHFDKFHIQDKLLCTQCSSELGTWPVTTRCGYTFCRSCVLESEKCPIDGCRTYTETDCPRDVIFADLIEHITNIITSACLQGLYDEDSEPSEDHDLKTDAMVIEHRPPSLRRYDSFLLDSSDPTMNAPEKDISRLVRPGVPESAFTCPICSCCYLEPMTLRCGHTFCRECLHQQIDQTSIHPRFGMVQPTCPNCRVSLGVLLPSGESLHHENTWNWTNNMALWGVINVCWRPELADSKIHFLDSSRLAPSTMTHPLFVCTPALPTQPTNLRIFEPRYRTMLRRILRTPSRTFAMAAPSSSLNPSAPPFHTTAVLLRIDSVVYEPLTLATNPPTKDMEIYVFTTGLARVHVSNWARAPAGYWTAACTVIPDDTPELDAEKERVQVGYMRALDSRLQGVQFDGTPGALCLDWLARAKRSYSGVVSRLRTQELVRLLCEFLAVQRGRVGEDVWKRGIEGSRGAMPSITDGEIEDVGALGWWVAGVFLGQERDRLALLEMGSARERLVFVVERIADRWSDIRRA